MIPGSGKASLNRAAVAIALFIPGALSTAAQDKVAAPLAPNEPTAVTAPHDDKGPQTNQFDEVIRPFLTQHCRECHGTEKPKGDLRLDRLAPDFADATSREKWE